MALGHGPDREPADSAQYTPIKKYAEEVKRAVQHATTTTTKPKGKHSSKSKASEGGVNVGVLFASLGGFVGLQHVCANLPSPGSTSSGQGAPAKQGQSRGSGGHPPATKGRSRGKVTVGF